MSLLYFPFQCSLPAAQLKVFSSDSFCLELKSGKIGLRTLYIPLQITELLLVIWSECPYICFRLIATLIFFQSLGNYFETMHL